MLGMMERGWVSRRLFGVLPLALAAVLALSACGSSDDDDEVEDVATRVSVAGAPDPLPTIDPNATPVEDPVGGAAGAPAGDDPDPGTDGMGAASPAAEGGGGEVVELSAPGIAWSTYEITISQGGTIELFNDGSGGNHNFVVEGYNDDAPVDMPIGEAVPWTVPEDLAPGTYTYYCSIPGHRTTMEGTITIT